MAKQVDVGFTLGTVCGLILSNVKKIKYLLVVEQVPNKSDCRVEAFRNEGNPHLFKVINLETSATFVCCYPDKCVDNTTNVRANGQDHAINQRLEVTFTTVAKIVATTKSTEQYKQVKVEVKCCYLFFILNCVDLPFDPIRLMDFFLERIAC